MISQKQPYDKNKKTIPILVATWYKVCLLAGIAGLNPARAQMFLL
jgi:hypothetical protein